MKIRFSVALLLGALLIFASSARATSVRTGSGYGETTNLSSSSPIANQWSTCTPGSGFVDCDLLVQINSSAAPGEEIQITLNNPLFTGPTGFLPGPDDVTPTGTFGLIDCADNQTQTGNLGSGGTGMGPCASSSSSGQSCNITQATNNTFDIPASTSSCAVAGETYYFDLQSPLVDGIATAPDVAAASIKEVPVVTTPEPSSLALFGLALLPLLLFSKRRVQA
jgi:PEP-CTERM motif